MTSNAFTSFAADAERLLDDPHAIGARLGALLAHDGWLAAEHRMPGLDTYRQHLLDVSPSRRLSVVALVWLPGQRTPIHDHVSWCVVGVYEGRERETRYRTVEVDGERCLEPTGSVDARPGHVEVIVPSVAGHPLRRSRRAGPTISIHVYGADIERLGTSIYRRFDDWRVLSAPRAARTSEVSVSMS